MTTENLITLIGIFSSAILGYIVKYLLDKKAKFSSETAIIKRDMYEGYIKFIMSFISNYDESSKKQNISEKEIINKMREFHRMAILYSSPKVINAFADFLQYSYKHPDGDGKSYYIMVLVTNIFREMRRDIGLSNRGLRSGSIRLIRPIINDYDDKLKPQEYSILSNAQQAANMTREVGEND